MLRDACFISDLHLFARRSQAGRHEAAIRDAAAASRVFVLGGDIFDFRWTTRGSVAESVDEAAGWLSELVESSPECRFHFVLGNHDHHRLFIDRLDRLSSRLSNLEWHRHYLRLDDCVFLHGDVVDRRMDPVRLDRHRRRWLDEQPRSPAWHTAYDLAVATRLPAILSRVLRPPWLVARRILVYLESIGQGAAAGVRRVYFGHTHVPVDGYRYGGMSFHNGGAPIRGIEFRVLQIEGVS